MSLQETLNQIKAGFSAQVPDEVKAVMARDTQALLDGNQVSAVLKVGEQLPPFALPDSSGEVRHVSELNDGKPLVISFFRGFW